MIGVYAFKSKLTGEYYVGSSVRIKSRQKEHLKSLAKRNHHSYKLQEHVNAHGISDLEFIVLERTIADKLEEVERFYIDKLDSFHNGFNCSISTKRFVKEKHRIISNKSVRRSIEDEVRIGVKYTSLEEEILKLVSLLNNNLDLHDKVISSQYVGSSQSYFDCLCRASKLLSMIEGYIKRKQKPPSKHKKFTLIKSITFEEPCSRLTERLMKLKTDFQKKEPERFINLGLSL